MKVLVVTTWLPTAPRPETGSFVVRDIEMLREDHDVEVLHLAATAEETVVDFPVRTVRMSPRDPRSIARAGRAVAERMAHADLVHTMAASALLPFRTLAVERPWVHTEHWSALLAPATAPLVARAALPLTRRLLARPDVVVAVGNDLAEAIRRVRTRPTVVIPNAVEPPAELVERPRGDGLALIGVGGLIARKGPDLAVDTLAELRRRGVDARLVWVGDGPMRAVLETRARAAGVAAHVEWRGRVAPGDVHAHLAEADVFLLPTAMETFGVSIAEALVAGRPVVVGADGEQASFVTEPDGILVADRSARAYADAVLRVQAANRGRSAPQIAARARGLFDPQARRTATAAAYVTAARAGGQDVDVVIAVHSAERRIDRAVASVLTSATVAHVIVVCHGVEPEAIRAAAGAAGADPRVRFLPFHDGVRSPAGPFNHGLDAVAATYLCVMGSDDELTPGAVDAWRRTARADDADVVIAPLRHAGGARVPTPPTLRRRNLRGARDRLAYRTAPLGLVRVQRWPGLRFTPGVATGEDLAFTTELWFAGARVSLHRGDGEYLIHDGEDRVTFTVRPLAEELRALDLLLQDPVALRLSPRDRDALARKLWRVSVFGAVHYRAQGWQDDDRAFLAWLVARLRTFAPRAERALARADGDLIGALADPTVPDARVDALSRRRRRFLAPAALLPMDPRMVTARDAPLRFAAATWLSGRR